MVVGRKERSKKKEERRKMNAFEMLSDLHGPTYIGFYLMAVAMAAMVAYLVRHYLLDRDKLADRYSESDLAPLAASLDPYEVAYLLGGPERVLTAALVSTEQLAVTHAGWVVRTAGTGGRSGRVQYETLVASSSVTGDGADDAKLPE